MDDACVRVASSAAMVRAAIFVMVLLVGCDETADTPAKTETKVEEAKPDAKPEPKPEAKSEPKAEPKAEPKPEPKPAEPTLASFESHAGSLWNDRAEGIAALEGGGFALVGRCEPVESGRESEWDACLKMFDAAGKLGPIARIGGTGTDEVFEAVIGTTDGGVVAVGAAFTGGQREAKAIRFDKGAKIVWERAWGGPDDDTALAILPTSDGGYVVTGSSVRAAQALDAAVWWLDEQGNELRERTFGGAQKDFAHAIAKTEDGFVLAGFTASKGAGKDDAWVLRIDAAGEPLWDRTYGGAAHDGAFAVVVEPSGEIVVAGDSAGAGWIARLDGKGELLAEANVASASRIRALVRSGETLVGVGTGADDPLKPAWAARFDAALKVTNERVFAHPRLAASDVIATSEGGVALTGNWPSVGSNYANFWLCKLDAAGGGCGAG